MNLEDISRLAIFTYLIDNYNIESFDDINEIFDIAHIEYQARDNEHIIKISDNIILYIRYNKVIWKTKLDITNKFPNINDKILQFFKQN